MAPQPYFDTEHEAPAEVHADCLLCGHHDEWGAITLRLAWFRSPHKITALPRCLDIEACRARVKAAGEAWPLLERGEQPTEPPAPAPPDVQEAPDDWI